MGEIKLAGTPLDRRSKVSYKRDEIVKYYKHHNLTMKEVGDIFGISKQQVWRYLHYDAYLERQKLDSKKYTDKLKEQNIGLYKLQCASSNFSTKLYKRYLVDCKNNFDIEKAFNKHFNSSVNS